MFVEITVVKYLTWTVENATAIICLILCIKETLAAPVKQGEKAGELQYFLNGKQIGSVDILTTEEVQRAGFVDYFQEGVDAFLL